MSKPYRLLISGSAQLSRPLVDFVEALGETLIQETDFVLVTGGLKARYKGVPTVDYSLYQGVRKALKQRKGESKKRLSTLLPKKDWKKVTRFRGGNVVTVPHTDHRSRRYYMVHTSDAVLTIEGRNATKEVIDLAWVMRKPVLPLPFTGRVSLERWQEYRTELVKRFDINDEEADLLESQPGDVKEHARLCARILQRVLQPICFVAMKFKGPFFEKVFQSIARAVATQGYAARRLDGAPPTGDIVQEIWDSIRTSDMLIADITDNSPNVLYELGIAHALGKKTHIIVNAPDGEVPKDVPFDIRVRPIIPYMDLDDLDRRLRDIL